MEKLIRTCKHHGLTEYYLATRRCKKCTIHQSTERKKLLKQRAVDYKGGRCQLCGYNKHIAALEFHHIDPSKKDFNIGMAAKSWSTTLKELDKCMLVCANCHREEHVRLNLSNDL